LRRALAGVANSEYARAVPAARRALEVDVRGDLDVQARWELAAALDGLGDFTAADELRPGLDAATWNAEPAARIVFDVSRSAKIARAAEIDRARTALTRAAARATRNRTMAGSSTPSSNRHAVASEATGRAGAAAAAAR
jgi:hypothetical protein